MAISIVRLFAPTQLTASAATIYTVPTAPTTTVLSRGRVRLANTSAATRQITLYAVPSGGSAGAGNNIFPAESLAANAHVDVDLPLMSIGDFLQGFADTASDVTISALDGILFS